MRLSLILMVLVGGGSEENSLSSLAPLGDSVVLLVLVPIFVRLLNGTKIIFEWLFLFLPETPFSCQLFCPGPIQGSDQKEVDLRKVARIA